MLKSIRDFNFSDKRVLLRCDFNVPLSPKGEILDDFRIKKTVPTIEYLIRKGAKVVLVSHLGRPEGKVVEGLRLGPIQEKLVEYLDLSISKAPDCIGSEIESWIKAMQPGDVLLLENLRFYEEEEKNEENFTKELAKLGDIYINEAFSVSHRNHASVVGLAKILPCGAGFQLEKEIEILGGLLKNPQKPLVAVIGGKKVEDKAEVIGRISQVADFVLIGGLIEKAIKEKHLQFAYPEKIITPIDEAGNGRDIGPQTIKLFSEKIGQAKTVFWSGPLGAIEEEQFSAGSKDVAEAIIKSQAFSAVGGGDTVEFVSRLGLTEEFSHLSLGGSAMLKFLSGEELPGLKVLQK